MYPFIHLVYPFCFPLLFHLPLKVILTCASYEMQVKKKLCGKRYNFIIPNLARMRHRTKITYMLMEYLRGKRGKTQPGRVDKGGHARLVRGDIKSLDVWSGEQGGGVRGLREWSEKSGGKRDAKGHEEDGRRLLER